MSDEEFGRVENTYEGTLMPLISKGASLAEACKFKKTRTILNVEKPESLEPNHFHSV